MTDLSSDDLKILRQEGCLVDAEAAANREWNESWSPGVTAYPMSFFGNEAYRRQVVRAAGILRAAGLEPGMPSLDLLVAAISRRRWGYSMNEGGGVAHIARVGRLVIDDFVGESRKPEIALALAFIAAIRAEQGGAS